MSLRRQWCATVATVVAFAAFHVWLASLEDLVEALRIQGVVLGGVLAGACSGAYLRDANKAHALVGGVVLGLTPLALESALGFAVEAVVPLGLAPLAGMIGALLLVRLVRLWRRFCTRSLVWQLTHAQLSVVFGLVLAAIVGLVIVQSHSSYMSALTVGLPGDAQLAVRVVAGVLPILVVVSGLAALALPLLLPPAFLLAWLAARGTARRVERLVAVEAMANARRDLLARVAHELKNPLAVLRTAVDGLRARGPRLPEIDVLDAGVRGLTHVVGDLTDLACAEVVGLRLVLEDVDLARSIDAVVRAHVAAASERSIALIAETGMLRGASRCVDRQRLEQVLANLVQNALRHVDPGGVVRVSGMLEHGRALIRVEDTGRGIEPELLEHVFEPGFSRDGGLGLGLALARELMVRMHGELRVESEPGKGACFTVVV